MFTGIIETFAVVRSIEDRGDNRVFHLECEIASEFRPEESVAHNGVCLTVVALGRDPQNWFDVQISAETVSKTNLGSWQVGTPVNLERALRVGDELGGHIVSGHVDGQAEVISVQPDGASVRVTFRAPHALAGFVAPKGSVALNGTSLTVNAVEGTDFGVNSGFIFSCPRCGRLSGEVRQGRELELTRIEMT